MSKGSTPRPFVVSNVEYANRWDAIFGRDEKAMAEVQRIGLEIQPECDKDPRGCWSIRCQLGNKCKEQA